LQADQPNTIQGPHHAAPVRSGQAELAGVESLRETVRRRTFDSAKPHEPAKGLSIEPRATSLGGEMLVEEVDLLVTGRLIEGDEGVRLAEITVVFGNLVLEDQVVTKRVPGELGDDAMILMLVGTVVGEDDVGRNPRFEPLKGSFDLREIAREETVAKRVKLHVWVLARRQEPVRAPLGLGPSVAVRREHHPVKLQLGVLLGPMKNGATTPDLDVIGMGPQTEDGTKGTGGKLDHCGLPHANETQPDRQQASLALRFSRPGL